MCVCVQIKTYDCAASLTCATPFTLASPALRFDFGTIIYLRPATMATDCGGDDLLSLFTGGFAGATAAVAGAALAATLM